jgi:multidrug efflux pump
VSALPQVDYPTLQVVTFYPGRQSRTDHVAHHRAAGTPVRPDARTGADGSASSAGASVVTLRFGLDIALDTAQQEVQAAINAAATLLPQELPAPPVYSKVNPADAPVMTLAISSNALPLHLLEEAVEHAAGAEDFAAVGRRLVSISGGQRRAVRVRVNPSRRRGLRPESRTAARRGRQHQFQQAKGSFDGPTRATTLDANDQLRSAPRSTGAA